MKHSLEATKVYKEFLESPAWWATDIVLSLSPWINIVWGAMKNAIEWTQNVRILRWLEFFEWLTSEKFQKELLESEQAMDWLAICFESYFKQRNKNKREYIRNIFNWFINLNDEEKENFELEKILDVLNKITLEEIKMLKILDQTWKYYLLPSSIKEYECIKHLSLYWIVNIQQEIENPLMRKDWQNSNNEVKVKEKSIISMFGNKFLYYILKKWKNLND